MKFFANGEIYHLQIHQNSKDLPAMLFLHGFMGSGKAFSPLIEKISPSVNPVTVDLLGHGESSRPVKPGRYETARQVSDLVSIIRRLQYRNLLLYGYSMGGRLAQHLYLKAPVLFSGLILESTNCGIPDNENRKERAILDEKRALEIESDFTAFLHRWRKLPLFDSDSESKATEYDAIMQNQDPAAMAASLRGFGTGRMPGVCSRLNGINKPAGLIAGERDEKYVDKMREMHNLIPGSLFTVAGNAGHRVHTDRPETIAKFLKKYIDHYG